MSSSCESIFGKHGWGCKAVDLSSSMISKGFDTAENITNTADKIINKTVDSFGKIADSGLGALPNIFDNIIGFLKNPTSMIIMVVVALFLVNKFLK
jgi:hypothetical protein